MSSDLHEDVRDPLSAGLTAPAASAPGFARKAFVSALSPLRRGGLELIFPDRSSHRFGESDSAQARLIVRRECFFQKCLLRGDIGFAESYMDGDWDTPDLHAIFSWILINADRAPTLSGSAARTCALGLLRFADRIAHILRPNSLRGARRNIADHYDLSNEFFALWLDPRMVYSSALFASHAMSLEEAQVAKFDRLCRLLRLAPGDHVLEIGCGWGGFALYAASKYGVRVTGLTLSTRQAETARARAAAAGLSDRIDILMRDFRETSGSFDKIVSIEMMEALGHDNLPAFCQACDRLLKPHGLAALQFITVPDTRYDDLRKGVDFIQKHIFPGSLLLPLNRVNSLLSRHGSFTLADLRDLSSDYAETLRRWAVTFESRRDEVAALGFDERFRRKWGYYLQYCRSAFATRHIGVVQALYTRPNNPVLAANPAIS